MDAIHRRRVLAAAVTAGLAVVGALACAHRWPPRPHPTTTSSTSWPLPGTPPTTTTDTVSGTVDCGAVTGDPVSRTTTTPPAPATSTVRSVPLDVTQGPGRCLVDAWTAGTPARLVSRQPRADGSGDLVITFDVLAPSQLRVTVEDTRPNAPVLVLQEQCGYLDARGPSLVPGDCQPLPPAVPPLEGGRYCGDIRYTSGWPTTRYLVLDNITAGTCFLDAWAAGTPARLVTFELSDYRSGRLLMKTYDVLGPGQLRVVTDGRLGPSTGSVTVEHCTGLTHDRTYLQPQNCTAA